eukprot:232045_1
MSVKKKKKKKRKVKMKLSVDINWIFEYSRHLYLKYVDNSADLSINVSHSVRKPLWDLFSKDINEEAFQKIMLIYHDELNEINLKPYEEIILIQTYLYHAFDVAFDAVWRLLQRDTFGRYQNTKQYQMLCKEINAQKLKQQRQEKEIEYSQSFHIHDDIEEVP